MNYIENLLQGQKVEWKTLGEVADYKQPTPYIVKSTEYSNNYKTPVLTAGQSFILGYTNEENGIYEADEKSSVIIFDDFTTSFHWVDFPFKVKSSAMKIIIPKEGIDFRFVYHAMKTIKYKPEDHARQWISKYSKIKIPLPPLAVQQEIANILDTFTTLEAELEAELDCRKRQYHHYRDTLLTFGNEVQWKTLGEVAEVGDGLHGTPIYSEDGKYYFINGNNLKNGSIVFNDNVKLVGENMFSKYGKSFNENTLFLSINGTIGNLAFYNRENILLGKSVAYFNVDAKVLNLKYLYYLLQTNYSLDYFEKYKTGSTIKNLGLKALRNMQIPLPPLEEQKRIVNILDKFDTLTNSITEGLPKEIELRRKQYEYYREQLLSFNE